MLNYIWAGLIISSLAFALVSDIRDAANDRFRNDDPLSVTLEYSEGFQPEARSVPVRIRISPEHFRTFYGVEDTPADGYQGSIIRTQRGTQLRFGSGALLPDPLSRIRQFSSSADDELQGTLVTETPAPDSSESVGAVQFEPVRFPRLHDITQAAFDFAETAAEIALGLIGVLALFLGLLKIAEAGGLIHQIVRVAEPLIHPFFPEIPKGHPAIGMIVLNLSANVLGLGNAATPLGIKAMEELQELNPSPDTATNSMVMLLAMNTASVQLVPPALLVAVMGLQVNELILPIILVTGSSLVIAVTAAKFLQRLPGYRRSDPMRLAAEEADDTASSASTTEDT